jgi:hypothetical protein
VQSTYKPPPGRVASKKCAKRLRSYLQAFSFPSITEALLQTFDRQNVGPRLEPASTGDNMSAYALRFSDCPVSQPASVILWPRLAWAFR